MEDPLPTSSVGLSTRADRRDLHDPARHVHIEQHAEVSDPKSVTVRPAAKAPHVALEGIDLEAIKRSIESRGHFAVHPLVVPLGPP